MSKSININKDTNQGIIDFLKFLLKNRIVKAVFSLKKIDDKGAIAYSLITDPKDLEDAVPFYPLMPVNAGKLLSRFTLNGSPKQLIAAVVKPCEQRGFVELIKREQGNLKNLLIISSTCGGVFPTKFEVDGTAEKNLSKYWNAVKKGENVNNLRKTCMSCEKFVPFSVDITVDILGKNDIDKKCKIFLNSKKAEEIIKDAKWDLSDDQIDNKKLEKIREKRRNEKNCLFKDLEKKMDGIDGLIDIFGKCIGCHGCSKVCPICYCVLCEFESSDSDYGPSNFETELRKRPGLRIPPGTIYYHLGRLAHIGISCVACGACTDVCPVDIPVSMIFKKVGESVQNMFDYIPGKKVEEEIPLITFEKDELSEFEG